jgi:pyruvate formate lyase activating enzyme
MKKILKEARYFKKLKDNKVKCLLCPHECIISDGKRGICRVRLNRGGILYLENYGRISSMGVDPIEKKPLFHFYPGNYIYSMGTYGCNFSCKFCQNWEISQREAEWIYVSPEEAVEAALNKDVIGIAYTYSEPSVWYEYIYDTSILAHEKGLKNVLVSNGYQELEALKELLPYIDAANIDLKAFNNKFYQQICGGTIEPVLESIKLLEGRIHLEVTTLIIPGLNDSEEELRELFSWLSNINANIPLHLNRYFPQYKMTISPTPGKTIEWALKIAREYLNYVYAGNINVNTGSNTYCPECKEEIIIREGYRVIDKTRNGKCSNCGASIYGVF